MKGCTFGPHQGQHVDFANIPPRDHPERSGKQISKQHPWFRTRYDYVVSLLRIDEGDHPFLWHGGHGKHGSRA
jgi:hypothetical protein